MFRKYMFVLLSLSIVLSSCGKSNDVVRTSQSEVEEYLDRRHNRLCRRHNHLCDSVSVTSEDLNLCDPCDVRTSHVTLDLGTHRIDPDIHSVFAENRASVVVDKFIKEIVPPILR
jgi:hypothetical protein